MVLSYDPVAGELVVDLEDGRPRFEVAVGILVVKYYADGGILFAEFSPDGVAIGYHRDPAAPGAVSLSADGVDRWRVVCAPAP